ncbi:MAG: 2-hydroxyacyl-CoA dehydratase family protein, partial [Chloroflexota bacterium]|nr:2-hydroxyacyl-CoA dehydratase family protein [Chloroflexota bacterium]
MTTAERTPGPRTSASKATATARKVSGLIKNFYVQAQEAAHNGEPIAWCMDGGAGAGPYELRRALGIYSIYPEHYATVCAAKQTGLPLIERAEGDGYANYTCSYARIGLGYAAQMQELGGATPPGAAWGGMPKPQVLIGRTTCDPGLNWFEAFSRYVKVPLHVFDTRPLPQEIDYEDKAVRRRYMDNYKGQILSLLAFLEKHLGRKIDWDRVRELMALHYRAKWLWHGVHELRKAVPVPMPSGDKFSCMFPNSYMLGTQEAVDFYQELYDEVKERVEHQIGVIPNEKYRLLFAGIPQWHNMAFFNALEEAGAVFVIENQYYPEKPPEVDTSDPLEAMA